VFIAPSASLDDGRLQARVFVELSLLRRIGATLVPSREPQKTLVSRTFGVTKFGN
jgi:hypothetical protein